MCNSPFLWQYLAFHIDLLKKPCSWTFRHLDDYVKKKQQQLNNRANTPSPVENKHIHLQDQNNQLQRGEKQK